jgi:hypothetical protein
VSLELLVQHAQASDLSAALTGPFSSLVVKSLQVRPEDPEEVVKGNWQPALEGAFPAAS